MPPPGLQIDHYDVDGTGGLHLFVARLPGANATEIAPYSQGSEYLRDFIDPLDSTVVGTTLIEKSEFDIRPAHTEVDSKYYRQGIATALYREVERVLGDELEPGYIQNPDSEALWQTKKWRAGLTELGRKVFSRFQGSTGPLSCAFGICPFPTIFTLAQ